MEKVTIKFNQDYQLRESDITGEFMMVPKDGTEELHPHEARDVIEAGFGKEVPKKTTDKTTKS